MRKFNLSLDDFSPHPKAGLNFEPIVWCNKLIIKHPNIKINLFVPSSYHRLGEAPYHLTNNKEWSNKVDDLCKENYRINFHGAHHSRQFWPKKKSESLSNNDEWQYISYEEAQKLTEIMIAEFKAVGLNHVRTFRPPGWRISLEAAKLLTEKGFIIAGDIKHFNRFKGKVHNMKWVSYNWDMTKPCDVGSDIIAYGHTSDWTNNYMDEKRYDLICAVLDKEEFDFRFIEELL